MTTAPAKSETPTIERRFVPLAQGAELRADEGDSGTDLPKIYGVACPWDSLSVELWRDWSGKPVYERFARGAFSGVLAENPDIVCLRDHDRLHLLGRTASGTLRVFESERGLEYEVNPPANEDGRTLVELVRRGDLSGSSFAFMADKVEWEETDTQVLRTIKRCSLLEDVSPVTRPAYPASAVSARLATLKAELKTWRHAGGEGVAATLALLAEQYRAARLRLLGIAV